MTMFETTALKTRTGRACGFAASFWAVGVDLVFYTDVTDDTDGSCAAWPVTRHAFRLEDRFAIDKAIGHEQLAFSKALKHLCNLCHLSKTLLSRGRR